jgi:two-component system CheB/CheR fusion protein
VNPLLQAVSALASARTLEELMSVVRQSLRTLMRADGVTLVLRDGGMCHYADEDAIEPLWKGRRFPLEACISGWVMQHREPAVIADIYADPRIPHEAYRSTFVRSLAMMPVGTDAPVAAIAAYWAHRHTATRKEREILRVVADAAALGMRNASLAEQRELALVRESEARHQAEDANQLKDDFLATLSHELRTPLHVIQSWLWQLRRSHDPEELSKAVEVVERNVALQSRLVEDLLDMSRASAGQLRIQVQLVNIAALCTTLVEVVQPIARAKNIHLELSQSGAAFIWGDPDRVQQMLWNVVNNAIKFTPEDGLVRLGISREARRVVVTVDDNGIGIDPRFLPFMFDRYRQADQRPARRYGGLGLGLNIVRELAHLHGATVRAESCGIDQGTRIAIEFPIPAVPDQPVNAVQRRAAGERPLARLDGLTILLVDDEPEGLNSVESVLRHQGAAVLPAGSTAEALQLLHRHRPGLLLTDLAMPGQDGLELMRAVRELEIPLRDTPAAVLSAHLASEFGPLARAAGFQLFLEKPVQPQELVERVAQLAGLQGAGRAAEPTRLSG